MTYRHVFALCLLIVGFLFTPRFGGTNFGPVDVFLGGGAVAPKSPHGSIRLDWEEVTMRLRRESYTVNAVLCFFNTGQTVTEWVGFPKRRRLGPGPSFYPVSGFIHLEAWINGQTQRFASEERNLSEKMNPFLDGVSSKVREDRRWLVWHVKFLGHAKTMMRIRYEARYSYCGMNCEEARYIYGTGSYWKGNISRAVFIVDSSAIGGRGHASIDFVTRMGPRSISRSVSVYELREVEPDPEATFSVTVRHR